MKKQLLMGTLVFAAMGVYSQGARTKPAGIINVPAKNAQKLARINQVSESNASNSSAVTNPQPQTAAASSALPGWNIIGGSRNAYGVLVSESKPLQYNAALNAVSFIHRVSATFVASPTDNSGAIVAEVSTDWGNNWDSTCIWSDATNFGRYPQGGIYNPSGNTTLSNAYVVGSGPTTNGSGWTGSWFASKQLTNANWGNAASATPGAQQHISSSAPFNANVGPLSFARLGFTSTTDGKVRSLGQILNNDDATTNSDYGFRGIQVVTGSFNAGVFDWTGDSINFAGVVHKHTAATPSTADDFFMVTGSPVMAWNEAGTHGYVVIMGARSAPTNSQSSGYQPIVWRTADAGASWVLAPAIDFASPTYSWVLGRIPGVSSNTNLVIPQFAANEGVGAVVDANNKLHIFSTIVGTSRSHPDSVYAGYSFTMSVNSPTATYAWAHLPGERPYIYDFMLDGATSTWNYMVIDSMSSEAPSGTSGEGGFYENPFDEDGGTKLIPDSRIQAGRTANGKFVYVSWAESDTNFVNGNVKYNVIPDIKVRGIDIQNTFGSGNYKLAPQEFNVSKIGANPQIEKKAVMHYMSPTSGSMTPAGNGFSLTIPFTVTHSEGPGAQPGTSFAQLTSNAHWFSAPSLNFNFASVNETALGAVSSSVVYPNPASGNAVLAIDMKDNATVGVDVYSAVGQLVKSTKVNASVGQNNINIDLTNLSAGIYMVNVKVGNATSTKKLIVQ